MRKFQSQAFVSFLFKVNVASMLSWGVLISIPVTMNTNYYINNIWSTSYYINVKMYKSLVGARLLKIILSFIFAWDSNEDIWTIYWKTMRKKVLSCSSWSMLHSSKNSCPRVSSLTLPLNKPNIFKTNYHMPATAVTILKTKATKSWTTSNPPDCMKSGFLGK